MHIKDFVTLTGADGVDSLFKGDEQLNWIDFAFDEQVVHVFPNMISRSVPGYWEVNQKTAVWAKSFYQPNTTIYDLGASLGAASWGTTQLCDGEPRIIAVEKSVAMVQRLKENLDASSEILPHNISVLQADICDVEFEPSSVMISNYCLQFIAPQKRTEVLKRIFDALLPGGVLLMAEKIAMPTTDADLQVRALHHKWKQEQGYSLTEIERKSRSIANVMPVDTLEVHQHRLESLGFSTIVQWAQHFNFVALLAVKKG